MNVNVLDKNINFFVKTSLTKSQVLILSARLYNSETWTLKENQKDRLRVLEMTFLRKIEGVTRRDRVRNQDIYTRLYYQRNVVQRIQQRQSTLFWSRSQDGPH